MAWQKDYVEGYVKEDIYVTINKKDLKILNVMLSYTGPIESSNKKRSRNRKIINNNPKMKNKNLFMLVKMSKSKFF